MIIGLGLTLLPIHNKALTDLATNSKGEVVFFLPAFGYLLLIMGTGMFLLYNWDFIRNDGWGDRRVTIPLLIIVTAIALSGIAIEGDIKTKLAPLGAGLSFFALYFAARILGKDIFLPLAIGTAVASLGIIVQQAKAPGIFTGGLVFEENFDVATGFILLGAASFIHRWRWMLYSFAIVALLASGAPEAVFALGTLFVVLLFRHDYSRKMIFLIVVVIALVIVGLVSGLLPRLYSYVMDSLHFHPVANYISPEGERTNMSTLGIRIQVIRDAMTHIKPLGDGYNLTAFRVSTVHNVPLIIVQQLGWPGIVAGIAWVWIALFCLVRTKWKYVWVIILSLSLVDHYFWTQLAPWFWALAGVSLGTTIKSDFIFKEAV